MKNTFSVKFYCRKSNARKSGLAPVEISVIVCGERQMWQLPKKCKPEEFSANRDIMSYCTSVENKINQIYTNLSINGETISAYKIKDIFLNGNSAKAYSLKQMFEDGLKMKAMENGDINTYNKYKRIPELFYKFTGLNERQEANAVKYNHIITFKTKIEGIHQPQTVFKEMQHLKYFFNLAFSSGKICANPFGTLRIKSGEKDKPYLTYEEIGRIRALKIGNDRLDKVRDIFLFLAFTGLEWADLIALQKDDVQCNQYGQHYIKKNRVKTGIEYTTILYEDAIEIWEFYDGALPIISPQKFNTYLKELAKSAHIDKTITSLTARHTFATYLLSEKRLPIEIVSKMLGHNSIRQSLHYSKLVDNAVFKAVGKTKNKPTAISQQDLSSDEIDEFKKLLGI